MNKRKKPWPLRQWSGLFVRINLAAFYSPKLPNLIATIDVKDQNIKSGLPCSRWERVWPLCYCYQIKSGSWTLPFKTKKGPNHNTISWFGPLRKMNRRRSTLPHSRPCSTIDAKELNFRVRDGNGCDLFAIVTGSNYIICCNKYT